LLVALDHLLGTSLGVSRIVARIPAGPSLAQQVPALVERDLDVLQSIELGVRQGLAGVRALERVFLVGQLTDAVHDVDVVHDRSSQLSNGSRGRPRIRSPIWLRLISDVPPAIDMARCISVSVPEIIPAPSRNAPSSPASAARMAAAS